MQKIFIKSVNILLNWQKTSSKFANFIEKFENKLWLVDVFVAVLGLVFLFLGIWLY
jgi:hypothetical protein